MAYAHLPNIDTTTPEQRLQALRDAKELMSGNGNNGGVIAAIAGNAKAAPGTSVEAISGFLRLAEYITTGHDYLDTHPTGKQRPIVNNTHVTVVAPPNLDEADVEHLVSHIKDGSFMEFMKDLMDDDGHDSDGEKSDEEDNKGHGLNPMTDN